MPPTETSVFTGSLHSSHVLAWSAYYYRLRRRLAADQARPVPTSLPLSRLVVGEVAALVQRVNPLRVAVFAVLVLVAVLLAEVALGELTPGPVLARPWRLAVAALVSVVGVAVWAVRGALNRTR